MIGKDPAPDRAWNGLVSVSYLPLRIEASCADMNGLYEFVREFTHLTLLSGK